MDGKYLLDTNIVIRLFAGDKRVVHFLNNVKVTNDSHFNEIDGLDLLNL